MAEPGPLSLADQVMVNALAALVLAPVATVPEREMLIDVLAEVLPRVNRHHPKLTGLIEDAEMLTQASMRGPVGMGRTTALLMVARGLTEFFRWRAGLALDALRNQGDAS